MEWIKIDRDENGFATEECLDKIFSHLPVIPNLNSLLERIDFSPPKKNY